MENKIKDEVTYKLEIRFKIDVPIDFKTSVFNSIILGLQEYQNREKEEWHGDIDLKIRIQNDLLIRLQSEIEQLIIKEIN